MSKKELPLAVQKLHSLKWSTETRSWFVCPTFCTGTTRNLQSENEVLLKMAQKDI